MKILDNPLNSKQSVMKSSIKTVYFFTIIGTLVWIGAIFLAPYLKNHSYPLHHVIYAAFSPICHQIESRCFVLFEHPLAVCTRCLGIYFGFLAGSLAYPLIRGFKQITLPRTRTFLLVSAPICIDAAANFTGLWSTGGWVRFLVGAIWGLILPYYFIPGFSEFIISLKLKRNNSITKSIE